jgi:hypothetical protein
MGIVSFSGESVQEGNFFNRDRKILSQMDLQNNILIGKTKAIGIRPVRNPICNKLHIQGRNSLSLPGDISEPNFGCYFILISDILFIIDIRHLNLKYGYTNLLPFYLNFISVTTFLSGKQPV